MKSFVTHHIAALRLAWLRLLAAPLGNLLSLLVMALALALPSGGALILDNLHVAANSLSGVQEISLFFALDATKKDVADIEARLRDGDYGKFRWVSKEDALKHLKAQEGLADIVANLPRNPLPDAFVLEPRDTAPDAQSELAKEFSRWPKIAHVQLDAAWVRRIAALLRIGNMAVSLLAALFASALVVITFNTIRLQIMAQAAEIEVARLIGATDAFIRRPFQYFGALQGGLGGLGAALLVTGGGALLSSPLNELLAQYGDAAFVPHGLSLAQIGILAALGALLGWLGAQCSVSLHLFNSRSR